MSILSSCRRTMTACVLNMCSMQSNALQAENATLRGQIQEHQAHAAALHDQSAEQSRTISLGSLQLKQLQSKVRQICICGFPAMNVCLPRVVFAMYTWAYSARVPCCAQRTKTLPCCMSHNKALPCCMSHNKGLPCCMSHNKALPGVPVLILRSVSHVGRVN